MDIDMENVDVEIPAPVVAAVPNLPKVRKHWKEHDELKLLKQYRLGLEEFSGKEAELAQFVHDALVSAGVKVGSVRSVRDHYDKTIKDFRAPNRIDEWKTGDSGNFTELEQILVDIVIWANDLKKRAANPSLRKTKEQEKQLRKNQKFQFAATDSLKKLKKENQRQNQQDLGEKDPSGELDGMEDEDKKGQEKPARERTSYNHNINDLLSHNKFVRARQLKVEEERLDLDKEKEKRLAQEFKHRMEMDKERMELEKKRENNQTLIATWLR